MIKKYVCPHCGGGVGGFRNDMYALQAEIDRLREELNHLRAMIAAAPTMLVLLKELIDIEGPQPGTAEWAEKVRAAIAEAEGTS